MNDNCIITECYIDTNLIETLVPPSRGYNHQKGCPAVAKKMKEKFTDSFAVGIMDNDKKKVSYLDEFRDIGNDGSLYVYKHRNKSHYIILITPAVEMFVLRAAEELNIDPKESGIPVTLEELKRETKQIDAKSSKKYAAFFKKLQAAKEFKKLAELVSYLKKENYNAQDSCILDILED